jgi:hypothetical protein
MPVLVPDPLPAEVEALLQRRHEAGIDIYDEVWEGVLHMAPLPRKRHGNLQAQVLRLLDPPANAAGLIVHGPFNVGAPDDCRCPDGGLLEPGPDDLYLPTAALLVEVISPDDDSWIKLPFYAAHHIDELLIIDPVAHKVDWLALRDNEYRPIEHSNLIDLGPARLTAQIDWPPTGD